MRKFLDKAKKENFALGAFNLDSFETLKAVTAAAQELNSAVIVEVSPGEENYLEVRNVASLVDNTRREFGIPIFLNLDHADDLNVIENALDCGFDLIHFDGSELPLEDNLAKTKQVVAWAHAKEVLVEGEIDPIGDKFTDPAAAKKFVDETGVDIFAVSVGNKHGIGENEKLDLDLLQKIRETLPETFFSLHGGSGISTEDIQAAMKLGVVKVNVNTELRAVFRQGLEASLKDKPDEIAWYELTQPALAAVQKVVEEKIRMLGSQGKY